MSRYDTAEGEVVDASSKKIVDIAVEDLARMLHTNRFSFSHEKELQDRIEDLFKVKEIPYEREFSLSPKDRIDFLVGSTGVEIKVDSSPTAVQRQLWRYAQDPRIDTLVLVSNRSSHTKVAREILGKPVIFVYLLASIF